MSKILNENGSRTPEFKNVMDELNPAYHDLVIAFYAAICEMSIADKRLAFNLLTSEMETLFLEQHTKHVLDEYMTDPE